MNELKQNETKENTEKYVSVSYSGFIALLKHFLISEHIERDLNIKWSAKTSSSHPFPINDTFKISKCALNFKESSHDIEKFIAFFNSLNIKIGNFKITNIYEHYEFSFEIFQKDISYYNNETKIKISINVLNYMFKSIAKYAIKRNNNDIISLKIFYHFEDYQAKAITFSQYFSNNRLDIFSPTLKNCTKDYPYDEYKILMDFNIFMNSYHVKRIHFAFFSLANKSDIYIALEVLD